MDSMQHLFTATANAARFYSQESNVTKNKEKCNFNVGLLLHGVAVVLARLR